MTLLRGSPISALGHAYCSHAAAASVADHLTDGDVESARRALTEMMLSAKLAEDSYDPDTARAQPAAYRARSRSTGIDVTARVVRQGALAIVLSAVVRSVGR